jgi:hypothetical protein
MRAGGDRRIGAPRRPGRLDRAAGRRDPVDLPGHAVGVWVALAASLLLFARAELPAWRPERADAIALAGGVLLFGSLFADWYGIGTPRGFEPLIPESLSAWSAYELTSVAIAVTAAIAIVHRSTPAAVIVIALVIYALLTTPDIDHGAWIGLAGAVLLFAGAGSNRLRARPGVAP